MTWRRETGQKCPHCWYLSVLRRSPADVRQDVHILLCYQLWDIGDTVLQRLVLKQDRWTQFYLELEQIQSLG